MKPFSISAIKTKIATKDFTQEEFDLWQKDSRLGVQKLILSYEKKIQKEEEKEASFLKRQSFELTLKEKGYQFIAGIDEVGRGPLAGPVVAAAVILPDDFHEVDVNDSKQLSHKRREELFDIIMENAVAVGIGRQSEKVIDEINIYQSTKKAMIEAVEKLEVKPDYLLLDAMKLEIPYPQESLIKGDAKSISIAAASIIAKVTRDRLMADYDELYPGYDLKNNMGYGTKEHLLGLEKLGPSPIHRKTFAPVKNYFHE